MAEKSRVRENPAVRRRLILDEAITLVGLLGYHGFTIQELAVRCGLTKAGLLHYFGSKEQLLVAILAERDRRDARLIPIDVETVREEPDGRFSAETFRRIIHAIAARLAAQPELVRLETVLQVEALNPAHPAHDYFLRREAMILDEFAALLAGHVADPRGVARLVLALFDGLAEQWLRSGQAFDFAAEIDQAAALLLAAAPDTRSASEGASS